MELGFDSEARVAGRIPPHEAPGESAVETGPWQWRAEPDGDESGDGVCSGVCMGHGVVVGKQGAGRLEKGTVIRGGL